MNTQEPIDEDALYNQLKDLPDFRCFPIPTHWFKKYNIPPIEAGTTKEFLDSGYTLKMMYAPKDLSPIIINEPQRDISGNIKLVKLVEPEKLDIKIISRPYDPNAKPLDISGNQLLLEDKVIDLSGDVLYLGPTPNDQSSENVLVPLEPAVQEQDQKHSSPDEPSCH